MWEIKEDTILSAAIVTDSNSGITQKQAEELGIFVLPMPFEIEGTTYFEDITLSQEEFYQKLKEDINLTQEQFYEKLKNDSDISTSQPTPESVMGLWDRILKEYDEVVHIPMSSGLSGSYGTSMVLANDYDHRVFPINNQRISVTQRQSVLDALALAKQGKNAEEIKEYLENDKFHSSIYIMLDTLRYLKKGGRITPAAAALGTLLRLKPVLQIQGERLDAFAKARTTKQAKQIMIDAIKKYTGIDFEEIKTRFREFPAMKLQIAHTENEEAAQALKQELTEAFPSAGDIYIDRLSLSVSCHIGPGALAIACCNSIV